MAMLLESLEARSSTAGLRTSATMPISLSPIRAAAGRRRAPTTTSSDAGRACPGHHPLECSLAASTWKLAPALAAGNTVILKPAEWAPLSASLLADLATESGLPPGVLNVVQEQVKRLARPSVSDRRVRRISFTGSPETAAHGETAGRNIVPFTAELGGKGPLVVFADSDFGGGRPEAAGLRRCRPDLPRRHQAPRRGRRIN